MRDYGKVHTSFWTSDDTRAMTPDGRHLALYLLTSPHANMLGCFRLPDAYVSEDTQWTAERVAAAFENLERRGFATRDQKHWVVLHRFLKWNPIENPNQGKAAMRLFAQVPDGPTKAHLAEAMATLGAHVDGTVLEPFRNPSARVPQSSEAPVREPSRNPSGRVPAGFRNQDQDQEPDQDPEQEGECEGASAPAAPPPPSDDGGGITHPASDPWELAPPGVDPDDLEAIGSPSPPATTSAPTKASGRRKARRRGDGETPCPPSSATDADVEAWLASWDVPPVTDAVWGVEVEGMLERARAKGERTVDWGAKWRTAAGNAVRWGNVQVDRAYPKMRSKLPGSTGAAGPALPEDELDFAYDDRPPPPNPALEAFKADLEAKGWKPPPMPESQAEKLHVLATIAGFPTGRRDS